MANTSSIEEKILNKAKERGEAILAEAKRKQEQVLNERRTILKREIQATLESDRKRLREQFQQDISNLRIEERRKTHDVRRRAIDEVYRKGWETALSKDNYRKFIKNELESHSKQNDTLIVSTEDIDHFSDDLKDLLDTYKVSIAEQRGKFRAGFIIPRGDIRLNCTLDERFKELMQDEEIEVAKILFE